MNIRQIPFMVQVNLGYREDRRKRVESQFREQGLFVHRQPGIRKDQVRDPWGFQNEARYACSLAKRLAIRKAKLAGAPAMLLFEDDLILARDLHERLAEIELPEDWGIFFLGCKHIERPIPIARNLLKVTRATDNHAMAIRADYYDDVIRALSGTGKGRPRTILYSDANASLVQRRIPTYAAFPNLAWQGFSKSDNEGLDVTYYDPGGRQRSRAAAIEGLEEEIAAKFPDAPQPLPVMESSEPDRLGADQVMTRTDSRLQASGQPLEEQFPLRFFLNKGCDEERRIEMECGLASQRIQMNRVAIVAGGESRHRGGDEREFNLLAHRMALREARRQQAPSVMVLADGMRLDARFRDNLEQTRLPEGWGILILGAGGTTEDGTCGPGWRKVRAAESIGGYVVHSAWFNTLGALLRRAGLSGRCEEIGDVVHLLAESVPIYVLDGLLSPASTGKPTRLWSWVAGYLQAKSLGLPVRNLPSPKHRQQLIDQLGMDVFADALHDFMRP